MFPQIIAIKEKQKNVAVLFWQFLFYQVPSSLVFIDAHVWLPQSLLPLVDSYYTIEFFFCHVCAFIIVFELDPCHLPYAIDSLNGLVKIAIQVNCDLREKMHMRYMWVEKKISK